MEPPKMIIQGFGFISSPIAHLLLSRCYERATIDKIIIELFKNLAILSINYLNFFIRRI